LFRPRETQNERLLREAGLDGSSVRPGAPESGPEPAPVSDPDAVSDPEPASDPGDVVALSGFSPAPVNVLGLPSPKVEDPAVGKFLDWPPLANVSAAELGGTEIRFFALADGSVIVDEQEGDAPLDPLLDALEGRVEPPYRAHAILIGEGFWSVSAKPVEVVELPGVELDDFTAARYGDGDLLVDEEPVGDPAPFAPLEQVAADRGQPDFFCEASRLEGATFAVAFTPL